MPMCPQCGADLKEVFRSLAAKGGKAARGGAKKTRSPEQYRDMQRKSVEARTRKSLARRPEPDETLAAV
jgi:hypothetical protein